MREKDPQVVFKQSFEEYSDQLFRFCVLRVSNRELAYDLTQDTFMRFWDSLCEGMTVTNARAWLYTTARHLIIDNYRKQKTDSLERELEQGRQFASDEHEIMQTDAEMNLLLEKIAELSVDEQELISLRYIDGLPPREIAEVLSESANVVSVRLHRAVSKLKALYDL